jgi:hypothetical protein
MAKFTIFLDTPFAGGNMEIGEEEIEIADDSDIDSIKEKLAEDYWHAALDYISVYAEMETEDE